MAKLQDKLYNRIIDGKLVLEDGDEVNASNVTKKISVSNITAMTDEQLNGLKVGDEVQKITGNQKHCYIVTYKEEQHGICLSYFACGYLETVSYDYTSSHWVYNSTDVFNIENAKINVRQLEENPDYWGRYLQVQMDGSIIPASVSGGTKLYKHALHFSPNQAFQGDTDKHIIVINSSSEKLTTSSGVSNKVAIDSTFLNKIDGNSNVVVVYPSSSLIIGFNTINLAGQVILYYLQTSGGISITSSTNTYVSEFDSEEI